MVTERSTATVRLVAIGVVALLVGAGIGLFVGRATTSSAAASDTSAELEIREIERNRLRALVDADMAIARPLHTEDFVLVPPTGYPFAGRDYLAEVESGDLDYRTFEPISEIQVRVAGDMAVVSYESTIDAVTQQGSVAHEAWHTYRYEKRDGDWQVAAEQATAVGGIPAPES